jgi:hypothetical protein
MGRVNGKTRAIQSMIRVRCYEADVTKQLPMHKRLQSKEWINLTFAKPPDIASSKWSAFGTTFSTENTANTARRPAAHLHISRAIAGVATAKTDVEAAGSAMGTISRSGKCR